MRNGRETVLQAGDETLGGKRNSNPYGDVIGRIGTETDRIRPTRVARDVLPAKGGRASLVRSPLWLHATGAVVIRPETVDAKIECAIAHRRVSSLQQKKARANFAVGRERERGGGREMVLLPRGHPTLPGTNLGIPVLPLIFDTTLELGATKLHATFPYPFLHLADRFETLEAVVTFS